MEYVDGVNRLTFSLNLLFVDADLPDPESFESAVVTGILDWQGEYEVFGGQRLQVVVQITLEDRLTDNVMVIAMTEKNLALFQKVAGVVKTRAGEKNLDVMVRQKRSGAITGLRKWSTRSKKAILIVSEDGTFRDMYEIRAVAKHEFGHALGLGDLYFSPSDGLEGVQKGTYDELDSYYQGEKVYNLVMSNHHGAISNNDMEMVVLAFSEDRMQLYQKMPHQKGEISKALGRGN